MSGTHAVVNDGDNMRQDPDDVALPNQSRTPGQLQGEDHEKIRLGRRSTMKGKFKDQKEKLKTKANPPGGFDSTPLPNAPPGYTVKFTFHRAENLPTADISTGASDPFLTATLSTSLPKRHKEEADLCYQYRSDHNDRLGNVTIYVNGIDESWQGFGSSNHGFNVKKRMGSKRAYTLKAAASAFHKDVSMTPRLYVSAVVLGKSDPPHGQIYTIGPTYYFKHFSPMIGRMTGIKVNKDEAADAQGDGAASTAEKDDKHTEKKAQKYDFQANEIQLAGPVPPKLYHRYVEFRPIIGLLFQSTGLRGHILNKALHHQHARIYNFDKSTERGTFEPCSEEASLQFLRMAHFDEGARLFTYIITLDGLMRFTETGKEFGIDLLSKHTMHSDAQIYIAFSGEFFIRKVKTPKSSENSDLSQSTQPSDTGIEGGAPKETPPAKPQHYQLIIDNDSGTYRPDKSVLPELRQFLERNFPGLKIVARACDDPEHQKMKDHQRNLKKKEGRNIRMVLNRSPTASSFSSSDISNLDDMEQAGDRGRMSKKERALEFLQDPGRIREALGSPSSNNPDAGPSTTHADGVHTGGGGIMT
ncbi:hypothetical protein ONZ43_g815 [Nemania bipapillata]|uniref:Uncharacterized protein n=1 Tax=Nemania bipapillata TaxID=110536 RepID=A0ACC2J6T2_9PEZI|nr:hypothetical protein ONZ43_g815 [Nemania bipapillata]